MRTAIAAALLALLPAVAAAQSSVPGSALTPGAIDPRVTQETIDSTICAPGWSRSVRPPAEVTGAMKREQIRNLGYEDRRLADYEEDHLIPLGLGGSPADPRNLWPEPRWPADGWTAEMKDELEAVLARLVCAHDLPLAEGQTAIARDWRAAWRRYVAHPRTS